MQGNLIGTDVTGTQGVDNAWGGVTVGDGTSDVTIGGTTAGAGNLISANHNYDIWITGAGTKGVVLEQNLIGTDITGTRSLANIASGVEIDGGAVVSTVGGLTTPAGVFDPFDFASGAATAALTFHSVLSGPPQGQTSAGPTAVYHIDMEMNGLFLAIVDTQGYTARLMLPIRKAKSSSRAMASPPAIRTR